MSKTQALARPNKQWKLREVDKNGDLVREQPAEGLSATSPIPGYLITRYGSGKVSYVETDTMGVYALSNGNLLQVQEV